MVLTACFSWLRRPVPVVPAKGPWDDCPDQFYIKPYRAKLEEIAEEWNKDAQVRIRSRFDPKSEAAQIVSDKWGVLAEVRAHGEAGGAYAIVVVINPFLKREPVEKRFRGKFGRLPVEFRARF
jgi:hypothetical protein